MGHRTLKRVPLDFDWPLKKVWGGYIAPAGLTGEEYDKWECDEPPTGEGYQLWETTSEGSPTSPVFESAEELAGWCEENATIFASFKASRQEWLELFQDVDELEVGSLMLYKPSTGELGPGFRFKEADDNEQ